jgi:gelsolin
MSAIEQTFFDLPDTPTFNVQSSSQRVKQDVYFWIRSESRQDEYGAAAIKAVDPDHRFQVEPTQHQEVQFHETGDFLKLFDEYGGVTCLKDGAASGFKAIDRTNDVQLYRANGRRKPLLLQVPVALSSLNQGDVFLMSDKALFLQVLWIH